MAPASAAGAALFRALAVALVAMALLQLSAAAAAAPPAPPIGLPGCETSCGNVSVPYPFGISPGCYWPGLNLTCNRSHDPPRLLLGDGTLRVTNISLEDATVRVMRTGPIIKGDGYSISTDGWSNASFGPGFTEYGYLLADGNELVVLGCNVVAMLYADGVGVKAPGSIAGCASSCSKTYHRRYDFFTDGTDVFGPSWEQCTGTSGCCQSNVTTYANPPSRVQAKRLYSGSNKTDEEKRLYTLSNKTEEEKRLPVNVFVAETGWIQQQGFYEDEELQRQRFLEDKEIPFLLRWSVTQGDLRPRPQNVDDVADADGMPCKDDDVRRKLCKSEHSVCWNTYQAPGYRCQCEDGYDGNPYLAGPGGCQDIDECKLPRDVTGCFGDCINTNGWIECRCPTGTFGNAGARGGCVKIKSTRVESTPTVAEVPFGLHPNCNISCGDVRVPYPFGIGPAADCSLPGFNLTCDTSYSPPRLLLDSNRTLEVVNISLADSTVHVIHHARILSNPTDLRDDNNYTTVFYDIPHIGEPYTLSTRNEFIFSGCNVQATVYGEYINSTDSIISRCNSTCSSARNYIHLSRAKWTAGPLVRRHTNGGYCSGRDDGCCHAPIAAGSTAPKRMEFKYLKNLRTTSHEYSLFYAVAFISEDGLTNQWGMILNRTDLSVFTTNYTVSPLVLGWAVKQQEAFTALPGNSSGQFCRQENGGGFTCHCNTGYEGNPYIDGGCKDIDECSIMAVSGKMCYAKCINFPGGHKCQCPRGSSGDPHKPGGCSPTGLIIGVAIGPTLLLLVLGIILLVHWMKQRRAKVLKQKYFKQNRGYLLQQLVSQEADIAERMIISVDELAKATNNFDKARELGGGGHGTVYKGILSNLRVVAIKKAKITVQKKMDEEIDEFINEVAILSQINHRNVVKLFGCCLETEVPLLVYEFISNGTLYDHLHGKGLRSLSWSNRLRIATEVATSLAYLHSAVSVPIIHRDIKSANILLDDTLTSKVADFGASRYIPIEKTGLTTRVQGTIGYLDPMYFYTSRLNEKSDVYSFGVILVELLTRKKPFSYCEGGGLAAHFVDLFVAGNLVQIIDPQVIEEGGKEVQEVAALATSCVNLRGEERPTMRQVEHTLEGLWGSKKCKRDDMVAPEFEDGSIVTNCPSSTEGGQSFQESSRRYSLEQEMMMSARYPR